MTLLLFGESLFRQIMEPHRNLPSIPLTFSDFPRTLKVTPNYGIVFLSPNISVLDKSPFLQFWVSDIIISQQIIISITDMTDSIFQRMFDLCAWTLAPDTCL